jgi:hypothetical protein
MADGLRTIAVLLVPGRRTAVQSLEQLGSLIEQARAKHVGEQVMEPVPPPSVVEWHEEEIATLEILERGCTAVLPEDGVAQGAGQARQDRGAEEEASNRLRLALQHLFHQVVDDVAIVAGESGDEAGWIRSALDRQRGQLECGDPALGPGFERRHIRS